VKTLGLSHVFGLAIPAIVSVPAALLFAVLGTRVGRGRPGAVGTPYREIRRRAFPAHPAAPGDSNPLPARAAAGQRP
jgi:hypothetical protein